MAPFARITRPLTHVNGQVAVALAPNKVISRQDDSAGAPAWLGGPRATGGRLSAQGRTQSRLEPAPHIQFRTDIVRISRARAEPDVLMPDRIPALLADHPADDAVTVSVITQRDRRTTPAVQPLIPPGQHRRQDREEVPAHIGQQVLIARRIVLVEPLARQLAHVARDVRGAVIPASGHNIALENPAALTQAYLDFFAGG